MSLETFESIISSADEANIPYTLSFSGHGDPLCHSKFYSFLDRSLESKVAERVIIETFATRCDENFASYLEEKKDDRIHVICKIIGYNPENNNSVHTVNTFEKA